MTPAGGAAAPLYLDYQATTPVDARVFEAMRPYFSEHFGNAASTTHAYGWRAEAAVTLAREQVAVALGASSPDQVIFTSGATESNNLALLGSAEARGRRGRHLISVATEHPSVLDPLRALERRGFEVTLLPVGADGLLDPAALRQALRPDTILVSVMAANNEIGVLQPMAPLAALAREAGALVHCDAAQAVTKVPFDVSTLDVDLVSVSAHKCYGPKGVGALWVRSPRVRPAPLFFGGGHEAGVRPGTLPVALLVGMGVALEIGAAEREQEAARLVKLRGQLLGRLREVLGDGVAVNGDLERRLPGNLNLRVAGVDATLLVAALRDIALSVGSACTSATPQPSHVLKALGLSDDAMRGSFRVGLGRDTDADEVDRAASRLLEEITVLRRGAAAGTLRDRPDLAPAGSVE